jgi:hypothetical protein
MGGAPRRSGQAPRRRRAAALAAYAVTALLLGVVYLPDEVAGKWDGVREHLMPTGPPLEDAGAGTKHADGGGGDGGGGGTSAAAPHWERDMMSPANLGGSGGTGGSDSRFVETTRMRAGGRSLAHLEASTSCAPGTAVTHDAPGTCTDCMAGRACQISLPSLSTPDTGFEPSTCIYH